MRFVIVNEAALKDPRFCALCCQPIEDHYVRERETNLFYCSYKCYRGHCEVAILALENHAREVS